MPLWSRVVNALRGERVSREIEEEFESHIASAIEQGRDPEEARKAFGPALQQREQSRDLKVVAWLDSLRADAVFGWRQIRKKKATSAAAILSLALAIGGCTSAFRLIDALLLRPLPVADPERLYVLAREGMSPLDGKPVTADACAYPMFQQMRGLVKEQAELIAISYADRVDLTYGPEAETEKAHLQYVSGSMFSSLGLRPKLGRLFTEDDERKPGGHPYAVLTSDYWTRRFGQDPKVIGRTFRMGNELYAIVGVAQTPFTGTEPGTVTDVFLPTMMMKYNATVRSDYSWFRTFVRLKQGVAVQPVREKLQAAFRTFQEERVKASSGLPAKEIDGFLSQRLVLYPEAAGVSSMQKEYGRALVALAVLVGLVLLIACANVANLMTAQAAARAREMALRVSIGAGRGRLIQLVLMESAWLAFLASALGGLFAAWAAPFVVSLINPPDNPARFLLPADWRVLGFGLAVALGVTFLFGLAPAASASAVKPFRALRGGEDPHSRRRLMNRLIAVQVAFCFLVLFLGGLFVVTFDRLSRQPTGFSAERLLALETVTANPRGPTIWEQTAERLRLDPGVEKVALSESPLMTGESWNGFISVNGAAPGPVLSLFLSVSPEWRAVMKIPLLAGRDFRAGDHLPGAAMVNSAFAKRYFGGENATGRWFEMVAPEGTRTRFQIVGQVGDALYRNLRDAVEPVAYFPFKATYGRGTLIVRTSMRTPLQWRPACGGRWSRRGMDSG